MDRRSGHSGITLTRPWLFWSGIAGITLGVLAHMPMFVEAGEMGYAMAGTAMGAEMFLGMAAIAIGVALTVGGLWPHSSRAGSERVASVNVDVREDGRINAAHVGLVAALTIAVVIDAMKPATLGFVVPGMAEEYGLKSAANPDGSVPVALLPLAGALGMSVGALVWGHFGDRIGRRASILFAGVLFIATSVCGAMPDYRLNLLMCFMMGVGVGGMIPITFALLAETIPARHRGTAMVLVGCAVAGAYALTSVLAAWLVPQYSWRILWLIGLPTGLLLVAVNRWIPESPRLLVSMGREEEARSILRRYGARLELNAAVEPHEAMIDADWRQIVAPPYRWLTAATWLLGFSAGFLAFGFQLWLPSSLPELGLTRPEAEVLLRDAALIAMPVTAVVAPLYGYWSSKRTIVALGALVAVVLAVLAIAGDALGSNRALLYVLIAVPIAGASALLMIIAAYSSEIYPTEVRARGCGAATSASRVGGVLIILLVVFAVATPSLEVMSLAGAAAVAVALAVLVPKGLETRMRALEAITRDEIAG